MRAVVQKVINASVAVEGQTISQIGRGLMVLVGVERSESTLRLPASLGAGRTWPPRLVEALDDAAWIIKKVLAAKLWDGDDAWRRSVVDVEGEVLCVSQFTLFANFKGARPDFHQSMSTEPGKAMYTSFLEQMGKAYSPAKIKDGQFGAMMQVSLTNDGPVTVLFDSKDRKTRSGAPSTAGSGASTPTGQSQPAPKGSAEAAAIARAKNEAKKAKKAEYEARKARGEIPGRPGAPSGAASAAPASAPADDA